MTEIEVNYMSPQKLAQMKSSAPSRSSKRNDSSPLDTCPLCDELLFQPEGPVNAPLAIIGEEPFLDDRYPDQVPTPFSGRHGEILASEFEAIVPGMWNKAIAPNVRLMYTWSHPIGNVEGDSLWQISRTLQHIKKQRFLLLLGSITTQALVGWNVDQVGGLWLQSEHLSLERKRIIAAPATTSIYKGAQLGEFRLALYTLLNDPEFQRAYGLQPLKLRRWFEFQLLR